MTDPVAPVDITIIEETDEKIGGIVADAGGNPIDLTLASTGLSFIIRRKYGDTSAVYTKSIGSGITVGSDGSYTVTIAKTDANLTPGVYYYALKYTAPAGGVTEVARGKLIVQASAAVA